MSRSKNDTSKAVETPTETAGEDLSIPTTAMVETSDTALLHQVPFDDRRALRLPQDLTPEAVVFRWEIPFDSAAGYVLPIEITNAKDEEEARAVALTIQIGGATGGDGEEYSGRELTPMERAWIKSTPPMVVRDTTLVTMEHYSALYRNERLQAQQETVAHAREILARSGIDPDDPDEWIRQQHDAALDRIERAASTARSDKQHLCNVVEEAIRSLQRVADATGFATPPPKPTPEPDYSVLTIVAPDGMKQHYPRLAAANWIEHIPFDEPNEDERKGLHIIFNTNNGLTYEWMRHGDASFDGIRQMEAAIGRAKALLGDVGLER